MRTNWTGVGTAMVTPFTASGELDEAAVRRLGRRQIDAGIHFLVPCGTTGESPTLTDDERVRIVEILVDEARGEVPVLAGAGGYNTREVIELADRMREVGASGLLSVTPYYNKPTQEGLYLHYRAIAESTPLPIILYNVQARTGVNIETRTLLRLAEIPNIVGVKEASGNITQICEVVNSVPANFIVLSGDDAITLPVMSIGGRGIVSVVSNEIPGEMVAMVEAAEHGDFAAARAVHHRIFPLMQVNFVEANPVPVKAAMAAMGLLEEVYRLPMCSPRPESKEKILRVLKEHRNSSSRRSCDSRHARNQHSAVWRRRALGADRDAVRAAFAELRAALSAGTVRAAEPDSLSPVGWRVNTWVKQGILLGFKFGDIVDASMDHGKLPFYDKDTLPLKKPGLSAGVRIVPGGSAVRDGAYIAPGVICMPPMYINIGAYVGEQSLIDSHALVGSCAQVGARVHISAAAQIGGVIEPVGALPVIIEDDVLVGGNTGIYEGAIIKITRRDCRRHGAHGIDAGLRSRAR